MHRDGRTTRPPSSANRSRGCRPREARGVHSAVCSGQCGVCTTGQACRGCSAPLPHYGGTRGACRTVGCAQRTSKKAGWPGTLRGPRGPRARARASTKTARKNKGPAQRAGRPWLPRQCTAVRAACLPRTGRAAAVRVRTGRGDGRRRRRGRRGSGPQSATQEATQGNPCMRVP